MNVQSIIILILVLWIGQANSFLAISKSPITIITTTSRITKLAAAAAKTPPEEEEAAPPSDSTDYSTATLPLFRLHKQKQQEQIDNNSKNHDIDNYHHHLIVTYLEINGFLITTDGVTILIDPLLEGPLNFFDLPKIYEAFKRVIPKEGITEKICQSLRIDCILITQGLNDHAHIKTLSKFKELDPTIPIIAPPSAKPSLEASGFVASQYNDQVKFMNHGQKFTISPRQNYNSTSNGGEYNVTTSSSNVNSNNENMDDYGAVTVLATKGALVGPPWQARENGYVLTTTISRNIDNNNPTKQSIYIEPHVEFSTQELKNLEDPVNVVISPISGQTLPAFELVHGPKDTIRLLEILQPDFLLPMQNGELDGTGLLEPLVSSVGSPQVFRHYFAKSLVASKTKLLTVIPGEDIQIC